MLDFADQSSKSGSTERFKGRTSVQKRERKSLEVLSHWLVFPGQSNSCMDNLLIGTLYFVPLAYLGSEFRPPFLGLCFCKMSSTAHNEIQEKNLEYAFPRWLTDKWDCWYHKIAAITLLNICNQGWLILYIGTFR